MSDIYYITFSMMSLFHPFFSSFLLLCVIPKIKMSNTIFKAVRQTWFMLAATTGTFLVFNIVYSYLNFVSLADTGSSYSGSCNDLQSCLKMILDLTIQGLYPLLSPSNFKNCVVNYQLVAELFYMVFGNILTLVFAGTLIDKFSHLREKEEDINLD